MTATATIYTWTGEAMVPLPHALAQCQRDHIVDRRYRLSPYKGRSRESHNNFFASVHRTWLNLPEHFAERFATDAHLRKWALIRAGWRNERQVVFESKADATRAAVLASAMDDYAVVTVTGCVVTVMTAKSQSEEAMPNGRDFQASKQEALEVCAHMIGITVEELCREDRAPSPSLSPEQPQTSDCQGERADAGELEKVGRGR